MNVVFPLPGRPVTKMFFAWVAVISGIVFCADRDASERKASLAERREAAEELHCSLQIAVRSRDIPCATVFPQA